MEVLELETWRKLFSEDDCNFDKLQEYLDFIIEARDRYDPERYSEWHHIFPKCLDPDKKFRDQGVQINGADHFRAHLILTECFYNNIKRRLSYVLVRMRREIANPEDYEKSRLLYRTSMKGRSLSEITRQKISNSRYHSSAESHLHYRVAAYNRPPMSKETRLKISRSSVKMWSSPEFKLKMSEMRKSENLSDETRLKLSKSHRKENLSEETINKKRNAVIGSKNPCYGKKLVNNGVIQKYVSKDNLEEFLLNNPLWVVGKLKGEC